MCGPVLCGVYVGLGGYVWSCIMWGLCGVRGLCVVLYCVGFMWGHVLYGVYVGFVWDLCLVLYYVGFMWS